MKPTPESTSTSPDNKFNRNINIGAFIIIGLGIAFLGIKYQIDRHHTTSKDSVPTHEIAARDLNYPNEYKLEGIAPDKAYLEKLLIEHTKKTKAKFLTVRYNAYSHPHKEGVGTGGVTYRLIVFRNKNGDVSIKLRGFDNLTKNGLILPEFSQYSDELNFAPDTFKDGTTKSEIFSINEFY